MSNQTFYKRDLGSEDIYSVREMDSVISKAASLNDKIYDFVISIPNKYLHYVKIGLKPAHVRLS